MHLTKFGMCSPHAQTSREKLKDCIGIYLDAASQATELRVGRDLDDIKSMVCHADVSSSL